MLVVTEIISSECGTWADPALAKYGGAAPFPPLAATCRGLENRVLGRSWVSPGRLGEALAGM